MSFVFNIICGKLFAVKNFLALVMLLFYSEFSLVGAEKGSRPSSGITSSDDNVVRDGVVRRYFDEDCEIYAVPWQGMRMVVAKIPGEVAQCQRITPDGTRIPLRPIVFSILKDFFNEQD